MSNKYGRGYFGVVCYQPKTVCNVGTLWRSAHAMGAAFLGVIGARYKKQASDTTNAAKHVPLFQWDSWNDFRKHEPKDCWRIAVEVVPGAVALQGFTHPERAVYILGPEDGGLPGDVLKYCQEIVQIPGDYCLNLAVAGSIVMYDRTLKNV